MLAQIFYWVTLALTSSGDVEALRHTAPEPIDADSARSHLAAARVAGNAYGVSPELLLSISAHESRYQVGARTPERGGKVSCGAMTPTPVARCDESASILDEYFAGAAHLAGWMHAGDVHSRTEALRGYAGGYALLRACRVGPVIVDRSGRSVDLCLIADVFEWRAQWIRRELDKARGAPARS